MTTVDSSSLDALPHGFLQVDAHDRVVIWNQRLEEWTGLLRTSALNRTLEELFPAEKKFASLLARARASRQPQVLSQTFHHRFLPVPLPSGHISGFAVMQQQTFLKPLSTPVGHVAVSVFDVTAEVVGQAHAQSVRTQLQEAQVALAQRVEELHASLAEKDILLKEIHHRVKNNLQVVSSLLRLQAAQIEDPLMREVFANCQNRVMTMAQVHEKLYRSGNLAAIDFGEHVRDLAGMLVRAQGPGRFPVQLEVKAAPVLLDLNTAIPAGLILNELVTNSLKYGVNDGEGCKLSVSLLPGKAGEQVLTVADNGPGFPAGFSLENTRTLGLKMINLLARQIHGRVELVASGGARVILTFPHQAKKGGLSTGPSGSVRR